MPMDFTKVYFEKVVPAPGNCIDYFVSYNNTVKLLKEIYNDNFIDCVLAGKTKTDSVYFVNNEVYVYVGIITGDYLSVDYDYSIKERNPDGSFPEHLKKFNKNTNSFVVVSELGYSSFKGIIPSAFSNKNKINSNSDLLRFAVPSIIYHTYPYGLKGNYTFEEIVKRAISIVKKEDANKIKENLDGFQGVPFALAIYKIKDIETDDVGYAALAIEQLDRAHEFARKAYTDSLFYCDDFSKKPYKEGLVANCPMNMYIDIKFHEIFKKLCSPNGTPLVDRKDVFANITYTIVDMVDNPNPNEKELENYYIKHIGEPVEPNYGGQYLSKICVQNAKNGMYLPNTYYSFVDGRTKWKTEYLVYQIVKKLYPNQTIYQYRPYFLKYEKGQLSYDIFITGINVAIEYQGKQHFEPVDFFGGVTSFEDNVRRDNIKKELSKKNNIKLVYILYNEDVSEKLVKNKIDEVCSK